MTTLSHQHQRALSPRILTPEAEQAPNIVASAGSDGDMERATPPDLKPSSQRPVSLLSALIQATECRAVSAQSCQRSASDVASVQSSVPSTAVSSPRPPAHGILQQAKSMDYSSDSHRSSIAGINGEGPGASVGLGFGEMDLLSRRLERVEERGEHIEWASDVQSSQGGLSRGASLKFAVAPYRPSAPVRAVRPVDMPENDDDESDSDDGYQEDEEAGFGSDDSGGSLDNTTDRYPFARSTNFDQHPRYIGSTCIPARSPSPAPALLPPPFRRGRGHVRVDDNVAPSGGREDKTCSRHRSPPPARSRSPSESRYSDRSSRRNRMNGRLSDAGPRGGRAGSPMPRRMSSASDDEEDDSIIEEDMPSPPASLAISCPRQEEDASLRTAPEDQKRRHSSALARRKTLQTVSLQEERQTLGIQDRLRRASGRAPSLRRSSTSSSPPVADIRSGSPRARRCSASLSPCPPALNATPALADVWGGDAPGGLTHRLESALAMSSPPTSQSGSADQLAPRASPLNTYPIIHA